MQLPSDYPGEITLLVGKKKMVLWVHHQADYEFWTEVFDHLVHFHYLYGLFRGEVTWSCPEELMHSSLLIEQYTTFIQQHVTDEIPHGLIDENGGQVSVLKMVCAHHIKNPEISFTYQSVLGQYGLVDGKIYILTGVGVNTVNYMLIESIDIDGVHTAKVGMPLDHVPVFLQREVAPIFLAPSWIATLIEEKHTLHEEDIYV